ncbi:hypothetical protein M408DRAFT_330613 [Serendipita vermifera MAFF 305830]|uniref:F-box domain-containing protein n=1 Tax=Serendipita vermifera MAFF 305830 TaxID=933852 RepID=A0A0C2WJD8_SERVB|nr:hypothetical protein M408DRAFT_330613 [Serendipita vermifera MAFF 305830]
MGFPHDAYDLPSQSDINRTKDVISEWTILLQSATEIAEQANALIRRLNDDIDALKAQIAPIKRLPFDILTHIFIEAANQDPLAPLTIELVCTTWRSYILKTHRAWSCVSLGEKFNPAIMLKYLTRSESFPVHLNMYGSSIKMIEQASIHISEHAPRIRTLELEASSFRNRGWRMNSLKCLRVFGDVTPDVLFGELEWGEMKVEYLEFTPFRFRSSSKPTIRQHFPHLQHLVMGEQTNDSSSWLLIVEECHLTLKTLNISITGYARFQDSERLALQFPSLKHLGIEVKDSYGGMNWPFDAITPLLRSYKEIHGRSDRLSPDVFHMGTEQVIHLQTNTVPRLEQYPSLECLHISSTTPSIDTATFKTILATARRLCKGFKALYLDDPNGRVVEGGGSFVWRVDDGGDVSGEVLWGVPSRCLLDQSFSEFGR